MPFGFVVVVCQGKKIRGEPLSLELYFRKSSNQGWFPRSFLDVYLIIISVKTVHVGFLHLVSLNKLLSSLFQKCFLSYSTFIAPLVFFVAVLKTKNVHCRQSLLIFIPELTRKCNSTSLADTFPHFRQGTFSSLIPGHHCGCLTHGFCQHPTQWQASHVRSVVGVGTTVLASTMVPPLFLKGAK